MDTSIIKSYFNRCKLSKGPIVKGRIYFYNIWGKYNDNTKALAEAYHRIHPEYELIYEVSNNNKDNSIPDYISTVISGTDEALKLMYSSMIVIDNDWGVIKKSGIGLKGKIICGLFKNTISKNTLYISTGHGTPLKKLGSDSIMDHTDCFISSTQYMGVLDEHSRNVYKRITKNVVNNIQLTGSPRNDVLFIDTYKTQIKNKIGIDRKKMILFAPTFRTKIENGVVSFIGATDLINEIVDNKERIVQTLSNRMGGEWIIGLRIHPGATNNLGNIFDSTLINANILPDMADYLCATDLLVTDYSSCMFDYMLTRRPCILFWTDEENYSQNERGLYFRKDELPYHVTNTMEELVKTIETFDLNEMNNSVTKFMNDNNFSTNSDSCGTIIDYIDSVLIHDA